MPLHRLRSLALAAFICTGVALAGPAAVFEGKWEIDKKQPKVPGAPEDLQLEIKENGNKLSVKSKYKEPKSAMYPLLWVGVMTYDLELLTDGTEKVNHIGPFAHASKTTVDGNKMTTDFTASLENGSVTGQWIRTLSDDGKGMTMQINTKASDGRTLNQTLHFKKK